MNELTSSIQIEETKKKLYASTTSEVNDNIVESKRSKLKRKCSKNVKPRIIRKLFFGKSKRVIACYLCGKGGYFARNYIHKKSSKEERPSKATS